MLIKELEKTHGMWITATGPSHGKIDTVWFRRTFSCPDDRQLRVKVSACSRYKCYLNGRFVCYGPCKGGHSYQFFDDVDLSGFLVPGENELLFEVVSFPDHPDPDTVPGPDWCVSLLPYASLAVIGSDMATDLPGWTWYRCSAVTPILNTVARWLGYTEEVRTEKAVSLSDTASLPWEPTKTAASVFGDDWGGLPCLPAYERPIPLLELCDPIFLTTDACGKKVFAAGSITVPPHTHLTLDLDAGEHVTAFVTFAGTKGTGARVTLLYAEGYLHPDGKGNFVKNDRLPGSDGILSGYSDTVIPGGTDFSYTPFLIRTFRYLRMDIVTADEPLILFSPSYRITRYPLTAISTVGEDSPAWISDIWDISLRTLRNCMHETFEDCPYYEQMQYAMDTRLEMLFAYRLSGETAIQKRTIFDYQASQFPSGALSSRAPVSMLQIIPSFSLYWILMLCDYYMQTGDISVLRDCFGTVDRILCYFRSKIGKSGLIENPGYWEFIDWVDAWDGGAPGYGGGPEGNHSFLFAYVLGKAASLARVLGYHGAADRYEEEKQTLLNTCDRLLYDPVQGLYRYKPEQTSTCQHIQVWAVLAGVRDEAFRRELMLRVSASRDLQLCSFPMQFYLFRAYEETGLYEKTEPLWDLWRGLLSQHLTTVPETPVDPRSDCHAWGSLILYEYPAKFLGVEPFLPGWKEISVKPLALYLRKASGRACVPDGYLDIAWEIKDETFSVSLTLSTDCPVHVLLPDDSEKQIRGRGKTVTFTSSL